MLLIKLILQVDNRSGQSHQFQTYLPDIDLDVNPLEQPIHYLGINLDNLDNFHAHILSFK